MDVIKDRKYIIAMGAAAGCVLLAYVFIFGYLMSALGRAESDRRLLRGKLAEARLNLPQEDLIYAEKCLISKREISSAIEKLASHGKAMSIDFISISLGASEKAGGCFAFPLSIEARSTYKNLGIFLDALRRVKRYIVKVRSLKIVPDKDRPGNVRVSMVLDQYIRTEGDAK